MSLNYQLDDLLPGANSVKKNPDPGAGKLDPNYTLLASKPHFKKELTAQVFRGRFTSVDDILKYFDELDEEAKKNGEVEDFYVRTEVMLTDENDVVQPQMFRFKCQKDLQQKEWIKQSPVMKRQLVKMAFLKRLLHKLEKGKRARNQITQMIEKNNQQLKASSGNPE